MWPQGTETRVKIQCGHLMSLTNWKFMKFTCLSVSMRVPACRMTKEFKKELHMAPSRNFSGAPKCQSTDGVRNLGPWSRAKTIAPRNLKSAKSKHGPDPNEKWKHTEKTGNTWKSKWLVCQRRGSVGSLHLGQNKSAGRGMGSTEVCKNYPGYLFQLCRTDLQTSVATGNHPVSMRISDQMEGWWSVLTVYPSQHAKHRNVFISFIAARVLRLANLDKSLISPALRRTCWFTGSTRSRVKIYELRWRELSNGGEWLLEIRRVFFGKG